MDIDVEWNCNARDLLDNFCNVIYTVTHFCKSRWKLQIKKVVSFCSVRQGFLTAFCCT